MPDIYQPPMTALPHATFVELWPMALAELRYQMTKATFNAWLADSYVVASISSLSRLIIAVRNRYAQEWLTYRLHPVIVRTLVGIAGHRVDVHFVSQNYAKEVAMNPLEDRLQEYLAQFDDEPGIALSLKRSAYLDNLLAEAGVAPINPVELPVNITPELLNTLLTEGAEPMTNQSNPTRVRIHSHITQSRFLHVEDSLDIGKIRLFAGNYRRNQGMNAHCYHFLDLADARVIFSALARGEQGFAHKEYKGTPPQKGGTAVSRVLSIAVKGENVYIELKTGPGKLTNTGAITPNGKAKVEVNVGFKLYEARRMAASVLAYIHAWDVMRMMYHHGVMGHHGVVGNQQMVNQPSPYLLVSTTSETNDVKAAQLNGASKPNGASRPPVMAANNGRPVTRKAPTPKATSTNTPATVKQANGQPKILDTAVPPAPPLQYGDGILVDMENLTEVQTFERYKAEKKSTPGSKTALLDFYQNGLQVTAGAASQ